MADVIAKWQDGTATMYSIRRWQMLLSFHSIDNFSIVGREDQNLAEALYIRINNPSLNRYIDKYHLPHIWHEVLHNTSELKIT